VGALSYLHCKVGPLLIGATIGVSLNSVVPRMSIHATRKVRQFVVGEAVVEEPPAAAGAS
jgi:hypothetical protein